MSQDSESASSSRDSIVFPTTMADYNEKAKEDKQLAQDQQKPKGPVSIFHPSARSLHLQVIKQSVILLLILAIIIPLLSIFWGSMHNRHLRAHNLTVWVINFDEGEVGKSVVDFIRPSIGVPSTLGFEIINPSDYHGNISTIFDDIVDEKAWAAVAIAPNATQVLNDAVANIDKNFDSSYLVQFVYNQARQETVSFQVMIPIMNKINDGWTKQFGTQYVQRLASTLPQANISSIATNVPSLLAEPITFTFVNVRPYFGDYAPAILITGLIYLIIVSFFEVPHFAVVHIMVLSRVKFFHAMVHRFILNLCAIFFLSLWFSLISLAFGQDFSAKYGRGGFVVYWMINFMAMMALGGASENMVSMIMAVFPPALGYWLIFWVAINAATSFSPLELSPGVYKIGKVLPVHNAQQAIRTVVFNTKSNMAINFAVFTVWIVINFLFSFAAVAFIKWWKTRQAQKAQTASPTSV